jgi:hypothetical protein
MTVHTCQAVAQAERRVQRPAWFSTVIFGTMLRSLCSEARLSGCFALDTARGLGPACATAEPQGIAWQGRAAIWVVSVPEHWTRAASLKRPFENRRRMPFTEPQPPSGGWLPDGFAGVGPDGGECPVRSRYLFRER